MQSITGSENFRSRKPNPKLEKSDKPLLMLKRPERSVNRPIGKLIYSYWGKKKKVNKISDFILLTCVSEGENFRSWQHNPKQERSDKTVPLLNRPGKSVIIYSDCSNSSSFWVVYQIKFTSEKQSLKEVGLGYKVRNTGDFFPYNCIHENSFVFMKKEKICQHFDSRI